MTLFNLVLLFSSSTGSHSDSETYRTVPNMTTGSEGDEQEKPRQYYPFDLIPGVFQVSADDDLGLLFCSVDLSTLVFGM